MKKLKSLILIFSAAVAIPMAYVVVRTYRGMAQEENAQVRFFAEALFDGLEQSLAAIIETEERRAVDEYRFIMSPDGVDPPKRSPLADADLPAFILGYLQNNPDNSFQTPAVADIRRVDPSRKALIDRLEKVNRVFNAKKYQPPVLQSTRPKSSPAKPIAKKSKGFADRYLVREKAEDRAYLGRQKTRVEQLSAEQAMNLAQDKAPAPQVAATPKLADTSSAGKWQEENRSAIAETADKEAGGRKKIKQKATAAQSFQAEIAPFQSIFVGHDLVFVFRRVMVGGDIFRQGFVVKVADLLQYLGQRHFSDQPMAQFTRLELNALDGGRPVRSAQWGAVLEARRLDIDRAFPAPFNFLQARLQCDRIPASTGRRALDIALALLGLIMLVGLVAIYNSARSVSDLAERRTRFVSSVTHELKTPLTNIRMYIEMLEQGIAPNREREEAYLQILGSESERLSRLINDVLTLSRLEQKQHPLKIERCHIEEVVRQVHRTMAPRLERQGFDFSAAVDHLPPLCIDRGAMTQILINLMENSIKFGHGAPQRRIRLTGQRDDGQVLLKFSDTGPGIARRHLKKIFNDFYRADDAATQAAGGTGIGLALVKKLVTAMKGSVSAANNDGPGCTIALRLPLDGPGSSC